MAGLAAAWRLAEAGVAVTVYERLELAGGRLRTEEVDGGRADVVVQLLASHYTETLRLARAAGVGELLVRASGRDALWRRGRAHPIAYGSAASMARSSALPLGLKARLATRYLPFLRRHAGVLDPNEPARARGLGGGESVSAWGLRELGTDFVELLAYPLLAAYYGLTPEETGSALYHALAHAALDVRLYAVAGGMARLADGVARALEARGVVLRAGSVVEHVATSLDGVRLSGSVDARHDAVVLALPPGAAASLAGLAPELVTWLRAVRVKPVTTVALRSTVLPRATAGSASPSRGRSRPVVCWRRSVPRSARRRDWCRRGGACWWRSSRRPWRSGRRRRPRARWWTAYWRHWSERTRACAST